MNEILAAQHQFQQAYFLDLFNTHVWNVLRPEFRYMIIQGLDLEKKIKSPKDFSVQKRQEHVIMLLNTVAGLRQEDLCIVANGLREVEGIQEHMREYPFGVFTQLMDAATQKVRIQKWL